MSTPHGCADPDACLDASHLFDGFRPEALAALLDAVADTEDDAECGVCHRVLPVAEWCHDGQDGPYALCATHAADPNADPQPTY